VLCGDVVAELHPALFCGARLNRHAAAAQAGCINAGCSRSTLDHSGARLRSGRACDFLVFFYLTANYPKVYMSVGKYALALRTRLFERLYGAHFNGNYFWVSLRRDVFRCDEEPAFAVFDQE
jgi:hypothetical protein